MHQTTIHDNQYLALRREFVLKVDRNRPLFYPLDYNNTQVHFIRPDQGFVLSLLNGDQPFGRIRSTFQLLFPAAPHSALQQIILELDNSVREHPSQTGIGTNGLVEYSDSPIPHAHKRDPREFILSPRDYGETTADPKTRQRLGTPINIYTVFTHRCFTRCLYCYAERKRVTEMPLSRWQEIIAEMSQLGIQLAAPDNGDTFARKDGIELLECLLEHKMHFLLSTKAHVSKTAVKRLVEAGFTEKIQGVIQRRAQLSIDAVDDEVARRILNVKKARTALTLETLENFLSFGIMPIVKSVITGVNCDQPKKIVDAFYERGARSFSFVRYQRSFHRHTDDLFIPDDGLPALREQFARIREEYPDIELNENLTARPGSQELTDEQQEQIWANRLGCGGGWFALGIGPDGKAFLCEQMSTDAPFIVGDARTQSIEEIWNSERLLRFIYPSREQFNDAVCHSCEEFEDCMWTRGRCYRDAYFAYGSVYQPPPFCPKNSRPGLRMT